MNTFLFSLSFALFCTVVSCGDFTITWFDVGQGDSQLISMFVVFFFVFLSNVYALKFFQMGSQCLWT